MQRFRMIKGSGCNSSMTLSYHEAPRSGEIFFSEWQLGQLPMLSWKSNIKDQCWKLADEEISMTDYCPLVCIRTAERYRTNTVLSREGGYLVLWYDMHDSCLAPLRKCAGLELSA